jgi:hypothetical protein
MDSIPTPGIFPFYGLFLTNDETGPAFQTIFIYYIQTPGLFRIGIALGRTGLNAYRGCYRSGKPLFFIYDVGLIIAVKASYLT